MQKIKHVLSSFLLCLSLAAALLSSSVFADGTASAQDELRTETQVNINTADAETLALALDGVGIARAHDIIAWREQNGEFQTIEQLQQVRGVGPATLERNRDRILLKDRTE